MLRQVSITIEPVDNACKMSVDMFGDMHMMKEEDISDVVEGVVGATDFMEMSEDAQIIFI